MKQGQQTLNPSKNQILQWINSHVEPLIGSVKRIQELGNGVAYLFLIIILRTGTIRQEKIIKNPIGNHDILQNLRLLSWAFQKLEMSYKIQPEKLAQMKYQDNFYLSCFLYRTFGQKQSNQLQKKTNENTNETNKVKKIKIVPPIKKNSISLSKDSPLEIEAQFFEDVKAGSQKKLKQIEEILQESQSSKIKLEKIAKILNLSLKKRQHKSVATMTQQINSSGSLSIEASYKRFLRPSLFQKSTFLNNSKIPISFEKVEKFDKSKNLDLNVNKPFEICQILPKAEFQEQMLLSRKKECEVNQKTEETNTEIQCFQNVIFPDENLISNQRNMN